MREISTATTKFFLHEINVNFNFKQDFKVICSCSFVLTLAIIFSINYTMCRRALVCLCCFRVDLRPLIFTGWRSRTRRCMKQCSETADEILDRIGIMKNNGTTRSKLDKARVCGFRTEKHRQASKLLEGTRGWNQVDVSKRCIHALFLCLRRALD